MRSGLLLLLLMGLLVRPGPVVAITGATGVQAQDGVIAGTDDAFFVLVAGDTMTGNLLMDAGSGDSPRVQFAQGTGSQWEIYVVDSTDALNVVVNDGSDVFVLFINSGAGEADVVVEGDLFVGNTTGVAGVGVTISYLSNVTTLRHDVATVSVTDLANDNATGDVELTWQSKAGALYVEGSQGPPILHDEFTLTGSSDQAGRLVLRGSSNAGGSCLYGAIDGEVCASLITCGLTDSTCSTGGGIEVKDPLMTLHESPDLGTVAFDFRRAIIWQEDWDVIAANSQFQFISLDGSIDQGSFSATTRLFNVILRPFSDTTSPPKGADLLVNGVSMECRGAVDCGSSTGGITSVLSNQGIKADNAGGTLVADFVANAVFDPKLVGPGTVTITNAYGLWVKGIAVSVAPAGGAITNLIGMKVDNETDAFLTNHYTIWSEDADAMMRHFGEAKFGANSDPVEAVDVTGNILLTGDILHDGAMDIGSATTDSVTITTDSASGGDGELVVPPDSIGGDEFLIESNFACVVLTDVTATSYDDFPIWMTGQGTLTIKGGWCTCTGTCSTPATIEFQDDGLVNMTGTLTCSARPTPDVRVAITDNGTSQMVAHEMMLMEVTNTPVGTTDEYVVCWDFEFD